MLSNTGCPALLLFVGGLVQEIIDNVINQGCRQDKVCPPWNPDKTANADVSTDDVTAKWGGENSGSEYCQTGSRHTARL